MQTQLSFDEIPEQLNIRKIWLCLMSTCLFARTNGTKSHQRKLYQTSRIGYTALKRK